MKVSKKDVSRKGNAVAYLVTPMPGSDKTLVTIEPVPKIKAVRVCYYDDRGAYNIMLTRENFPTMDMAVASVNNHELKELNW